MEKRKWAMEQEYNISTGKEENDKDLVATGGCVRDSMVKGL